MKNTTLLINDANELLNGLAYKYTELEENELPFIDGLHQLKDKIIEIIRISEGEEFSTPILIHIENGIDLNIDNVVMISVNKKFKDLADYFIRLRCKQN